MKLTECVRGDLVAIVWPHGSDYSRGPFGDYALRGTEQLVFYGGPQGGQRKGPKAFRVPPDGAFVTVCDWETHRTYPWAFRLIEDVEILELVERRHEKVEESVERALGRDDDSIDPIAQRMAHLPKQGWG